MSKASRRTFLGSAAAAAAIGALSPEAELAAQAARSNGAQPPPDLRLTNGRIHTMDAKNTANNASLYRSARGLDISSVSKVFALN
jgi:hypothetical protein